MPKILDDCYAWATKYNPCNKAANAKQVADNFVMHNRDYRDTDLDMLSRSIEKDKRFDKYIERKQHEKVT